MDLLSSPEGFFIFIVGCNLLGIILYNFLKDLGGKSKNKAQSKTGVAIILVFVAVIWIVFSAEIALLWEIVNQNSVIIIALLLLLIAILIFKKKSEPI